MSFKCPSLSIWSCWPVHFVLNKASASTCFNLDFSGWFASTGVWNYSFVSISDISAQFEEYVWIITTPRDLMISWTRTTARAEAANQIRQGSDPVSLELLYCLLERTTVTRGDKVVMGNKKRDCDKKRPALMWVCEYRLLKRMISKSHIWDRVTCFIPIRLKWNWMLKSESKCEIF